MPELSLRNIEQIITDIRNEEISFSHLLDDLIDHVCCDVEYEMRSGLDFSEAYGRVKRKMGSGKRLREIQEETLYAVDTNYRNMKNTMKISGITGTVIFGFAALFKIQHWPGAGIMLTFGAFILAFVFMPSAIGVLWKETHNMKRLLLFISGFITGFTFISGTLFKVQHWPMAGTLLLVSVAFACFLFIPALLSNRLNNHELAFKRPVYIAGAIGSIIYALGFLFKIQHWPGATTLMISGLIILCIIAFPWHTWITWKDEAHVTPEFIFILIAVCLIMLPGALINLNLNLQSRYEGGFYPHLEKQKVLFMALAQRNKTFLESHKDSPHYDSMQLVHNKTSEITGIVYRLEAKMIEESEGKPDRPDYDPHALVESGNPAQINYYLLEKPFNSQTAKAFLSKGCVQRMELENLLAGYITYISAFVPEEEYLRLKMLADTDSILPVDTPERGSACMLSALHSTALLKNNLEIIESRVLRFVADKLVRN